MTDAERLVKAQADKAEADALAAQTAANKAARDETDAVSEAAEARKSAELAKTVADADKARSDADEAAADARQTRVSSLIPDFSKVTVPDAKVEGDQPYGGSLLGPVALREAVKKVVSAVQLGAGAGAGRLLLTDNPDLASADATYQDVADGLVGLTQQIFNLLGEPPAKVQREFAAVGAALVGALPGLISMVLPRRSVSSKVLAADTTAAVAEVAGQLTAAGREVHLDDFRLVPRGAMAHKEQHLRAERVRLLQAQLGNLAGQADQAALRDEATARLARLQKTADEETGGPSAAQLKQVEEVTVQRDDFAKAADKAGLTAGLAKALTEALDAFLAAIHDTSKGSRSAFATAALHEEFYSQTEGHPPVFSGIVFIKAASGSVDQAFINRFGAKARFASVGSVSVSYWMVDPATSNVVVSGVAIGAAQLGGKVGETPVITPLTIPEM